jgi:beta-glucosidase
VSLKVKNSGQREGSEVVQLYLHEVRSSVERPFKELKEFAKVTLKPGETKNITIRLDNRAFSFYDVSSKKWVAEPGEFDVLLGSSSRDIKLKKRFEL